MNNQNNKYAVQSMCSVLQKKYDDGLYYKPFKEYSDKQRNVILKQRATRYFSDRPREQKYLMIFAREFDLYLSSSDWLKTGDAKQTQKYFDFLCEFENLKEKMKEFRWNKNFLKENGIDFAAIRDLYFAVA